MQEKENLEIDLMLYWSAVWKRKKLFVSIVIAITLGAIIFSLLQQRAYQSATTIIPVNSQRMEGSGILSGIPFQGLPIFNNMSSGGVTQKIFAILQSKSLSRNVIRDLNLIPIIADNGSPKETEKELDMAQAVKFMLGSLEVASDEETGVIQIFFEFKDPVWAAKILNHYPVALEQFINNSALTLSKRNRLFLGHQLENNKRKLLESSKALAQFYSKQDISGIKNVIDVSLDEEDYAMLKLTHSANEIKEKADRMTKVKKIINADSVVKDVPVQSYLQYMIKYQEILAAIQAMLAQQYEMSKIEEAKESLEFQVLDMAEPEYIPVKPRRRLIVMISFVASLFISLMICFSLGYIQNLIRKRSNFS